MKRKQSTRWVFLYKEVTKKDWQNYAEDLNLFLERKLGSSKGVENRRANLSLNELWDIFQQSIISAANKNLPRKKIVMGEDQKYRKQPTTNIWDTTIKLSKVIRILQKSKEGSLSIDELQKCNDTIDFINHGQGTQIPKIKNLTEEVIIDLKEWWKLLNARAAVERSRIKRLKIEDHVECRCAMIENDQKKMHRSLLNKLWKSIKLNRIFEQDGVDRNLITEEEAVLERTMLHFQQQFRKRRTHLSCWYIGD
ncbi:20028_t:CDS:1, partial [Gigaspora rosea]